jgi:hypothetical protein
MAKCGGFRKLTSHDVAHRRLAEEAFILAIELTRALVAYLKCGARGIESLDEHAFPGCNQSKLPIDLPRT